MHQDQADGLPLFVEDDEILARAIFHPYHITDSGRLKPAAFKAPGGRRDVSVNRLRALSPSQCKERAHTIANPGSYRGFAVVAACTVRLCGSDVVDSRDLYLGHADILHPIVLQKNEPAPPQFNAQLKRLVDSARWCPDPAPESESWTGQNLSADPESGAT
jgi:hypothetical protein